jgi:uncharacterized cupredoxin-like copper-binding protein
MMGGGSGLVLVPVLVLVLVGVAVALALGRGAGGQDPGRAHDILRQRLAVGEIDPDEYRERAELLGPDRPDGSPLRRWLPAGLVMVAVFLLLALLLAGTGWPGGGWWGHMEGRMGGHMDGMWGQRTSQRVAPDPVEGAEELIVEMTEMTFDPIALEVGAGEPANLTVINAGRVLHDLTIDELDLQVAVDSGQTATVELETGVPGRYAFYCSVPGHASAGMQGTLTVLAP